jgi:murein DD-endopeptidase MepM/ murein hydrolase activator NlpD
MVAGLLPLRPAVSERWGWSGSWVYPVGDPYTMHATGGPEFRVMRSVRSAADSGGGHQGADLSNGRGGDPVRAAGNGLVVAAEGRGWHRGYGSHVVLAHRLGDGSMVYSVYAHLAPGSMTLHEGQFVPAGRLIGRVGMTGRATSPHLHFEVRLAPDPSLRWEKAPVVDPLLFVGERLPSCQRDSSWARPYVEWAECAALIGPGENAHQVLSRAEWWRALAGAVRHPLPSVPADAESLRRVLVAADLLPEHADGAPGDPLGWREMARDLDRARHKGLRLPVSPIRQSQRREDCRRELDTTSAAHDPEQLGRGRDRAQGPTRAAVCLALADCAGDPPRSRAPRSPRRPG